MNRRNLLRGILGISVGVPAAIAAAHLPVPKVRKMPQTVGLAQPTGGRTLSSLTSITTITDNDQMLVVDMSGASRKITFRDLRNAIFDDADRCKLDSIEPLAERNR